jgi:hypothetical protein
MIQKSYGPDFARWRQYINNRLAGNPTETAKGPVEFLGLERRRWRGDSHTIKASVAVALCGAISLKLRKMTTSQNDLTAANSARRIVFVPFANRPVLNIQWLCEAELHLCSMRSYKRPNRYTASPRPSNLGFIFQLESAHCFNRDCASVY